LSDLNIRSLALIGSGLYAGTGGKGGNAGGSGAFVADVAGPLASVSAASFAGTELAPESITAAFGAQLAAGVASAAVTPLPTMLAGASVRVTDSMGIERPAPLFFVSPNQINYLVPAETAPGPARVEVASGGAVLASGAAQIAPAAPGLFAANANGQGAAAAVVLRLKADGSQRFEPAVGFDPVQNKFVPAPIDLGSDGDQVFLIFFGTGFRFRAALSAVTLRLGGVETPALFAGAQGGLIGLDQLNVAVPRSLAGRGEVEAVLTVEGRTANKVLLRFK
jgi:uncharacterized protein (TIGR03437 family)